MTNYYSLIEMQGKFRVLDIYVLINDFKGVEGLA